ncbi:MAG: hypothetical protein KDA65_00670 [Planctomycetaceae bacterium]|nr:hypothetical protein [Planctomycetaceae bacterium]
MAFVLCRHCLGWVEPVQHRCGLCSELLNLSEGDPSLDVLTTRMGFLNSRLGFVQLLRNELPQLGHLYSTTKGFLFLPQEMRDVVDEQTVWKPTSSSGHWWSTVKSMMPQAALIDWFAHRFQDSQWNEDHFPPPELDPQTPQLLGKLLMQHPGVLFIELSGIHQYRNRKRNWTLYRQGCRSIHLRVLSDWREFQIQMEEKLKLTYPGSAPVEMR